VAATFMLQPHSGLYDIHICQLFLTLLIVAFSHYSSEHGLQGHAVQPVPCLRKVVIHSLVGSYVIVVLNCDYIILQAFIQLWLKMVKWYSSSWGNPSESYGASPVIWDHTVLPAARPTQVNVPCLNPRYRGRYSTYLPWRDGRL